jgi:hypothetical protein
MYMKILYLQWLDNIKKPSNFIKAGKTLSSFKAAVTVFYNRRSCKIEANYYLPYFGQRIIRDLSSNLRLDEVIKLEGVHYLAYICIIGNSDNTVSLKVSKLLNYLGKVALTAI